MHLAPGASAALLRHQAGDEAHAASSAHLLLDQPARHAGRHFVYVNAGTQLARIDSLSGIVSPGLLGSLVLLGVFPLIAKKIIDMVQARKIYARWKRPAHSTATWWSSAAARPGWSRPTLPRR